MKIPKKYSEGDCDIYQAIVAIRRKCDDYMFDFSETDRTRHSKTRKEHLEEIFARFKEIEEICK